MDIQEALKQIRQISSALEAFKTVDELLVFIEAGQDSIEAMTTMKAEMENVISEKNAEIGALENKYATLATQLQENYERARSASQESLKSLREGFNKDMEEAKTFSHGKINEFNEKVSQMKVETKNLDREIKEKQTLLDELNKSFDIIKMKLGV